MKRASRFVVIGVIAALGYAANGSAEVHTYVGTKRCRSCHQKEGASWAGTPMGKAFDDLKPGAARSAKLRAKLDPEKDYTTDKNCISCHTTGYGKQGGFVDLATTPDMAGVGCETCHGAGAGYAGPMAKRDYRKADLVALGMVSDVSTEQCTPCHNSKMAVGTFIGSRHFTKELVFSKTKGIHVHEALRAAH